MVGLLVHCSGHENTKTVSTSMLMEIYLENNLRSSLSNLQCAPVPPELVEAGGMELVCTHHEWCFSRCFLEQLQCRFSVTELLQALSLVDNAKNFVWCDFEDFIVDGHRFVAAADVVQRDCELIHSVCLARCAFAALEYLQYPHRRVTRLEEQKRAGNKK